MKWLNCFYSELNYPANRFFFSFNFSLIPHPTTKQSKPLMEQYFDRINHCSQSAKFPPRIRFMLRDLIELRRNDWVPRKLVNTEGPVPMHHHQLRPDDDVIHTPYVNRSQRDQRNNDRDSDSWMSKMPLNFQSNMNHHDFGTGGLTGSPNFSSQSYNSPVSGNYNNRDYRDGGSNIMGSGGHGGGGYRHNNNQRNNPNHNNHNNYNNHNRYNNKQQHNQHNNSSHNNYNNNSNNKQLPPRFKQNLITPPPSDTFENYQFRPATNSLLYQGVNFKTAQLPMQQPRPTSASSVETTGSGGGGGGGGHGGNFHNHSNNYNSNSNNSNNSNNMNSNNASHGGSPVLLNANANQARSPVVLVAPAAPPVNNILNKDQVLIKQASTEKPKQNKKPKGPNKEEVLKRVVAFVKETLTNTTDDEEKNMDDIVAAFIELKVPEKFMRDAMTTILIEIIDKSELTLERVIEFLGCVKKDGKLQTNAILEGFKALINGMSDSPVPRIATLVASLLYRSVTSKLCRLADVANYSESGAHYPLFLLVLQQLHKNLGKQALIDIFTESKVNLMSTLPEADRTKDRMAEILEDRNLSFLYPLLKLQGELQKQIQTDPNPQVLYKWIKDNVDAVCYTDPGFITALMNVVLKFITQVSQ